MTQETRAQNTLDDVASSIYHEGSKRVGRRGEQRLAGPSSSAAHARACSLTPWTPTSGARPIMISYSSFFSTRSAPSIRGLHSFRFQLNLSSPVHRVTRLNP